MLVFFSSFYCCPPLLNCSDLRGFSFSINYLRSIQIIYNSWAKLIKIGWNLRFWKFPTLCIFSRKWTRELIFDEAMLLIILCISIISVYKILRWMEYSYLEIKSWKLLFWSSFVIDCKLQSCRVRVSEWICTL